MKRKIFIGLISVSAIAAAIFHAVGGTDFILFR